MAQAEARVRFPSPPLEICGVQVALLQVFLPVFRISAVYSNSTTMLPTLFHLNVIVIIKTRTEKG
jgi:hypothetical protein